MRAWFTSAGTSTNYKCGRVSRNSGAGSAPLLCNHPFQYISNVHHMHQIKLVCACTCACGRVGEKRFPLLSATVLCDLLCDDHIAMMALFFIYRFFFLPLSVFYIHPVKKRGKIRKKKEGKEKTRDPKKMTRTKQKKYE